MPTEHIFKLDYAQREFHVGGGSIKYGAAASSYPPRNEPKISDVLETPLDTFDLIQIGKWHSESTNHSLVEFADA
jgi:hypothetical protein